MLKTGPHFFFDFDSTIVSKESLDEVITLALDNHERKAELVKEVEEITNLGMEGGLDFTESLTRRLAVVPLTQNHFESVGQNLLNHITPGLKELFTELAEKNISVFIISGGFSDSILPVAKKLGVDENRICANAVLYNQQGEVTDLDKNNVCFSNDGKAPVITYITKKYDLSGPYCMIGDGSNDLKAYTEGVADYFCAFTANVERQIMRKKAPALATSSSELRDFIFRIITV